MDSEQIDAEAMEEDIKYGTFIENPKEEEIQSLVPQDEDQELLEEKLETPKTKSAVKKRTSLTIEKKIEIIQRHEKGETQRALSEEYNVGRTTVSDILKRKYKFYKFMALNVNKEENLKRRRTLRRTVHKDLEDKLLEWYNDKRAQGDYVSGPMIAVKAQEMYKELGYTGTFSASNGWLDRFKVRSGIKLCGLREVQSECDVNAVAPFKAELESLANWYNLSLDQIYNADEFDLFWKMLPNPVSDVNEVKASVRAYRERMTVLSCANASGTHKLPLVCIGRGKKSRTFNAQEIKTMPVQYFSQETAWMDSDIFTEWFHQHFVPTVREHLKNLGLTETAILLIDRSPSHPPDQNVRSSDGLFICQYFPSKVKSLIQPMEQGIISNMKRHYRKELLNELINKDTTIAEFQKSLTIKEAILGIAQGWDTVGEETIRHGFSKIFPYSSLENFQAEFIDDSISNEAFAVLITQIPECEDYSRERLENWLNCDEAEPQKDFDIFRRTEEAIHASDSEEKVVFIESMDGTPIELVSSSAMGDQTETIIEQASDEEFIDEDQEELIIHHSNLDHSQMTHMQQPTESNFIAYEENLDVTCRQAVDALNVVLKFMKNDADSRYKDVVMLQDLKKKLARKLNESMSGEIAENDSS